MCICVCVCVCVTRERLECSDVMIDNRPPTHNCLRARKAVIPQYSVCVCVCVCVWRIELVHVNASVCVYVYVCVFQRMVESSMCASVCSVRGGVCVCDECVFPVLRER